MIGDQATHDPSTITTNASTATSNSYLNADKRMNGSGMADPAKRRPLPGAGTSRRIGPTPSAPPTSYRRQRSHTENYQESNSGELWNAKAGEAMTAAMCGGGISALVGKRTSAASAPADERLKRKLSAGASADRQNLQQPTSKQHASTRDERLLQKLDRQNSAMGEGSSRAKYGANGAIQTHQYHVSARDERLNQKLNKQNSASSGGVARQNHASNSDERLRRKLTSQNSTASGVSSRAKYGANGSILQSQPHVSSAEDRLRQKLTNPNSATSSDETSQQRHTSTPAERLRQKLTVRNRHNSTMSGGSSRAKYGTNGAIQQNHPRSGSNPHHHGTSPDERLKQKLSSSQNSNSTVSGDSSHQGVAQHRLGPSRQQASTREERLRQKMSKENSTMSGGNYRTTHGDQTRRHIETPEERLRRKLSREASSVSGQSGGQSGATHGGPRVTYYNPNNHGNPASDQSVGGRYDNSNAIALEERIRQKSEEDRDKNKDSKDIGSSGVRIDPRVTHVPAGASNRPFKGQDDPRFAAVGAYAVVQVSDNSSGRSSGRGRGRGGPGRGRSGRGRGRGGSVSRPPSNPSSLGGTPTIFQQQHHSSGRQHHRSRDDPSAAAPSTIATRTLNRVESGAEEFHNQDETAMEPDRSGPKPKRICGLSKRNALLVAIVAIIVMIGAIVGVLAGTGTFTNESESSNQDAANDVSQQSAGVDNGSSQPQDTEPNPPESKPRDPVCELKPISSSAASSNVASSIGVALSSSFAAVASYGDNIAGSVTLYRRNNDGSWTENISLESPGTGTIGDQFGRSLDLEDDVLVVGATYTDDTNVVRGCVYVFLLDGSNRSWTYQSRIVAEEAELSDESFGMAVAVDFTIGDAGERRIQVLVGQPFDIYYPVGERTGRVHVFIDNEDGDWTHLATLRPRDGFDGDSFGLGVDLDGGRAVVAGYSGSVHQYLQDYDRLQQWTPQVTISPLIGSDVNPDLSGTSIAIHARMIAVGYGGVVRIFDFGRSRENLTLRPSSNDGSPTEAFGGGVAIKDGAIVVAAPPIEDQSGGSVYVYQSTQLGKFEETDRYHGDDYDKLGFGGVAVDRSTFLVGYADGTYAAEIC